MPGYGQDWFDIVFPLSSKKEFCVTLFSSSCIFVGATNCARSGILFKYGYGFSTNTPSDLFMISSLFISCRLNSPLTYISA